MSADPLLAAVRIDFLERALVLMADLEASNDRPAIVRTLTRLNELLRLWVRAERALDRPDSRTEEAN